MPDTRSKNSVKHCDPRRKKRAARDGDGGGSGSGDIALTVLPAAREGIARSRNAPRRAAVLIAIHIIIGIHIALWLAAREFGWFGGKILTPVEPSESMQTIEIGFINAGFIIFSLALLSTLIFGRFFCGWACHVVALQDLCGWIMKKFGIRPKPFRSRLLIWVPLGVALYMFIWPTFKRLAVFPILEQVWPAALAYFKPVAEWQGASNHLTSEYFWSNPETGVGFPIIMAIPTLLIVGFAAVYFLGAKGFCTYGCPYGGFFAPLDEFAPGRIRVDPDKCEHCGHCTATCTSNVRVHEEVAEYGMVVDPGCMKCMDCISICPNDALYFGFGKSAAKKGKPKNREPKRFFDLSLREDIALVVVFLLVLVAVRGLYLWEGVPFLMAVGVAGVFSFLAFKSWRIMQPKHELIRLQNMNLKWRGRIRPAGWILLSTVAVLGVILAMNGVVNFSKWRAEIIGKDLNVSFARAPKAIERPQELVERAARVERHLHRALGVRDGGFALMSDPQLLGRTAQMRAISADFDSATHLMSRVIAIEGERDGSTTAYAAFLYLDGRGEEALAFAEDVFERNPEFDALLGELAYLKREIIGLDHAIDFAQSRVNAEPQRIAALAALAELRLFDGPYEEARALAQRMIEVDPKFAPAYRIAAEALFKLGRIDDAAATIEHAIGLFPNDPSLFQLLGGIYHFQGREEEARRAFEYAESLHRRGR